MKRRKRKSPRWSEIDAAYWEGDWPRCFELLEGYLDDHPGNRGALKMKGQVLNNMHRYHEAERVLRNVVSARPNDASVLYWLADTLWELSRLEEARKTIERSLEREADWPRLSLYSSILRDMGDLGGALRACRVAIEMAGPREGFERDEAEILHTLARYQEALGAIDRELRNRGPSKLSLRLKADILEGLGRFGEARRVRAEARELQEPDSRRIRRPKRSEIEAARDREDWAKCLELLDRYLERESEYDLDHVWKAQVLYDMERYEEAESLLREFVSVNEHPWALQWLAKTLYAQSRFEEAKDAAERALERGADWLTFVLYDEILVEMGELDTALLACRTAMQFTDPSEGLEYVEADILWRMERREEALVSIETELARNGPSRLSLDLKALILEDLGRDEEARATRAKAEKCEQEWHAGGPEDGAM